MKFGTSPELDLNLNQTDIRTNGLSYLLKTIFSSYLSKNPYDCNCGMEWFLRRIHLKDFTQTIKDVMEMTCDTPARLKGRHVYRLTKKDICPPVDECKLKTHKCHKYAECLDREYGYACTCRNGFTGDGKNCVGKSDAQWQM